MSLGYLSITYGEERILKWVKSLNIFRLCSLYPYPNDLKPVRFLAKMKYIDENELEDILKTLDIKEDKKREETNKFREHNENILGGYCLIANTTCYLDINKINRTILIEVYGSYEDPYNFDESVFQKASTIEAFLRKTNLEFIEPPQDDRYCICPKYYPEIL